MKNFEWSVKDALEKREWIRQLMDYNVHRKITKPAAKNFSKLKEAQDYIDDLNDAMIYKHSRWESGSNDRPKVKKDDDGKERWNTPESEDQANEELNDLCEEKMTFELHTVDAEMLHQSRQMPRGTVLDGTTFMFDNPWWVEKYERRAVPEHLHEFIPEKEEEPEDPEYDDAELSGDDMLSDQKLDNEVPEQVNPKSATVEDES